MKFHIFAAAVTCVLATPAHSEHLAPRNECGTLEGADAFQMALVTAVANRNAEMLRPLVHPQVHLDFGGGRGWELMGERLQSPDYDLWAELDEVIRLGCDEGHEQSLVMPYYWGQDYGDLDAYGTYIVVGTKVPLYRTESGERTVRNLNWEAVEFVSLFETAEVLAQAKRWEIKTRDGARGFVEPQTLRALVDFRLIAERQDGTWVITTFIAGD